MGNKVTYYFYEFVLYNNSLHSLYTLKVSERVDQSDSQSFIQWVSQSTSESEIQWVSQWVSAQISNSQRFVSLNKMAAVLLTF